MVEPPPDKFTGNEMLLGMMSTLSCLISELIKCGALDRDAFLTNVEATATENLNRADQRKLGEAMHVIVDYLQRSVPGPSRR